MTDPKKIADGLRRYNAWRRNNDEDLTLEAHAENNDLAQRVEELEAELEAVQSKNFDLRTRNATLARMMRDYYGAPKADASRGTDELVGLRGCNSRHGVRRAVEPCIYRMRTTDPGCTGCVERDEDQPTEAGD